MSRKLLRGTLLVVLGLVVVAVVVVAIVAPNALELLVQGDERELRSTPETPAAPSEPTILILAVDGVDQKLIYEMLKAGELPKLAALLGAEAGAFPHTFFDDTALASMPTSTLASWATIFTGAPPAVHGVAGNEYFIRSERRFAAPAPVSIDAPDLVLQVYTDDYANKLLGAPTLYEQLRAKRRDVSAWVATSQFFRGADRLIVADRTVLGDAFAVFLNSDDDSQDLKVFSALDRRIVENVVQALEESAAPHVITVYLSGADHYAHSSKEGPDVARRRYLREDFEPLMEQLTAALSRRDALENRYVLVVSDHGHTAVIHDPAHALAVDAEDDPPAVVTGAGFKLRPFELDVDEPFDTVLAYGGAVAYVYVADRTTCVDAQPCDWAKPPRREADVMPLAEAFHAATTRGEYAPSMRGSLELILVRGEGGVLEEYVGQGRTRPVPERDAYVDLRRRLRELTVGPRGDHAGDLVLVARNGAEPDIANRFYFSKRYFSWHGSPGPSDSRIPFILAHPKRTTAELSRTVRRIAGDRTDATDVTPVVLELLTGREQ